MLTLDEKKPAILQKPDFPVSSGKSYEGNWAEQYGGERLVAVTN